MEIFYDLPTLARLAAVMREVAPEILLTHPPADYMEDHMNACRLAVTAAFAREMPNFPTDPPRPIGRWAGDDLSCPAARQSRSAGRAGAGRASLSTSRRDRPARRPCSIVIRAKGIGWPRLKGSIRTCKAMQR